MRLATPEALQSANLRICESQEFPIAWVQTSISSGVIVPSGTSPRVDVIPALDVNQILRARQQRTPAETDAFVCLGFVLRAIEQLVDDRARSRVVRIHVRKQHEVRQQHAPVLAESRHQPGPVDLSLPRADRGAARRRRRSARAPSETPSTRSSLRSASAEQGSRATRRTAHWQTTRRRLRRRRCRPRKSNRRKTPADARQTPSRASVER